MLSVLRLLREPRWVAGLATAVVVAVVCVVLGQWQWERRQAQLARSAPILSNYDATPRPLTQVLPPQAPQLPRSAEWTPVTVTGRYDPARTLLARNRPLDKTNGYEVLVPLHTTDGQVLLVDRGWIPAGADGRAPDTVPAPPAGTVEVTVRLRRPEADRDGGAPAGQLQSISLRQAGDRLPYPVLGAYGVLAEERPRPAQAPLPLPRPDVDEGPHLGYTIQWYGFALTALVVWVVAGRRELQARAAGTAGSAPVGGAGAQTGVRRRRSRPRVEAGSDEAAEDAEVDALPGTRRSA